MPFIKPFSISHSKLALFRRCKQAYKWKYIDKHFPPTAIGQARGIVGHEALAVWHKEFSEEAAMNAAWVKWWNSGLREGEDWDLIATALERYFKWSGTHDQLELIESEKKFDIMYKVGSIDVKFTGYIDGVVKTQDRKTWLFEHKFLKRMDNTSKAMDMQMSLYLLAAQKLGLSVYGAIYNKIRIGSGKIAIKEPVVRSNVYRNPEGLKAVEEEMLIQAEEMIHFHKICKPYRNPTRDCSWDCAFRAACLSKADDSIEPVALLAKAAEMRR